MAFHRLALFIPALAALSASSPAATADARSCVTIQRGALEAVTDASVVSFGALADRNFGQDPRLYVGKAGPVESRALLRFDLGEIPPRAEIQSATVTLGEPSDTGSMTIDVHRITAPWDEHFATWSRSAGAFDSSVEASFAARGPAGGGDVAFDVTPLVRTWIGGAAPNHGVMLVARDSGLTELCSTEYPETKRKPRLEVCFTPPPSCDALWSTRVDGGALATDSAGNAIVAGQIQGAVTVAKLDPTGRVLWSKRFESSSAYASAVAIDGADNVLITGGFRDTIDFGAGVLDNPLRALGVAFVAKLDPDGHALWSRRAVGSERHYLHGIAADTAGNVVVTGSFERDFSFTSEPRLSAPGLREDIFLAKFAPTGDLLWEKRFGGAETDRAYGIAMGRGDDILLTGFASRTIDFGGGPLAGEADFDMFVARLGPDGVPRWVRRFHDATGEAIAVDASDHVIVGANGSSVFYVGPNAPPAPERVMAVLKLDPGGGDIWSKRLPSAERGGIRDLAVDAAGNIVLTGFMRSDVDVGGTPLRHVGEDDIFLAKLDPEGRHLRSCAFGDPADQSGEEVAIDRAGNVLLLAQGEGRTAYGPGLFADSGSYVTKLAW
ncbi:DNRLRE domain-containing protein [Polyangium sp. 15x6]|uniref:DNRLRE domain-containing protein n=1 Tax=Polyangium sp. 15x6 TaxID=3042687 RepID=UPI00249B5E4F|nr:DNRLRE domain-containing protein [Polyangium sp. 15x6]MDI3286817.1 DNRLRE domain-containing protein [Polyangium sp. 15x6]